LYSEEGTGRSRSPPRPLFTVPDVTAQCPPINSQCINHRCSAVSCSHLRVKLFGKILAAQFTYVIRCKILVSVCRRLKMLK